MKEERKLYCSSQDVVGPNCGFLIENVFLVYNKILDFQDVFEGQLSLIFWMASKERWYEVPGDNAYEWHLDGSSRNQRLELGRCIWNGAQNGVRRIEAEYNGKLQWIGLHHHRIS